jgi:hypothetical protein
MVSVSALYTFENRLYKPVFFRDATTREARLGSVARVYELNATTGAFSLVAQKIRKLTPSCVTYRVCEMAVFDHVLYSQIF